MSLRRLPPVQELLVLNSIDATLPSAPETVAILRATVAQIEFARQYTLSLIPGKFRKAFSRGSDPASDAAAQMSAEELSERLAQVHQRSIAGLQGVAPEVLLEAVEMPYAAYPIKLGAIMFCPLHEHIHAGQIGLTRRLLGLPSVR